MCLNCGCGRPNDRHGNDANITADDIERAADANGQELATTVGNMTESLGRMGDPGSAIGRTESGSPYASGFAGGDR